MAHTAHWNVSRKASVLVFGAGSVPLRQEVAVNALRLSQQLHVGGILWQVRPWVLKITKRTIVGRGTS